MADYTGVAHFHKLAEADINTVLKTMPSEYSRMYLQMRQEYAAVRLRQDRQIIKIYEQAAEDIRKALLTANQANTQRLRHILRDITVELNHQYANQLRDSVKQTARLPFQFNAEVLSKHFDNTGDIVTRAGLGKAAQGLTREVVEVLYTKNRWGQTFSDRIWKANSKVNDLVLNRIASGQANARTIARDLEKYMINGRTSLTVGESKRLMEVFGSTLPKDLKYDAFRLARTELSIAFAESTYSAGEFNPFYLGIHWRLSSRHPVIDICDDLVGFHVKGSEPMVPHPNCLCSQLPHMEKMKTATDRAIAWVNGKQDPTIENWYRNKYVPYAS